MASVYNFTIDQGADFSLLITYQDANGNSIDLTTATLAGKAKATFDSEEAFAFSFSIRNQVSYPGQFYMTLADTVSGALDLRKNNKFLYDVELTLSGIKRLFQGTVTVNREVTI